MAGSLYRPKYRRADGTVAQSRVWWLKFYDAYGKCIRESTETEDRTVARRKLTQRVAAAERGEPIRPHASKVAVDALMADLFINYRVKQRRSAADAQRRWGKHLQPFFGGMRAAGVGTDTVNRYIASRQDAGAMPATINRELALLKRAFSIGRRNTPPTVLTAPHFEMLAEDNARRGFFEPEQFAAVRDRLPAPLRPVVTFAYLTGWRIRSEVLPLEWRQVDFTGRGSVRLDPGTTKNKQGRTFVMTAELRALLEAQRVATEATQRKQGVVIPWVFHRRGRPIRDFYTAWRTACRLAGCPGMIPHDFRRTAARNLTRAGISEHVAMLLTGHRTREVFRRYDIATGGDLEEAAEKLDAAATLPVAGKVTGKVVPFAATGTEGGSAN